MTYQILHGNNLDILPTLADNSIDSIVTDPPYELGFMGKKWDSSGIAYSVELWQQCLRVLKPGGHLLSFGGTRTYHRVAVAIEDAGFELRDSIAWLYGSGFPKSLDVSKAIDKQAGAEREPITEVISDIFGDQEVEKKLANPGSTADRLAMGNNWQDNPVETKPATPEAQQWQGWGTALKPAFEPVIVARKGIEGTVANNVLKWGTGGLNIDGSRIGYADETDGGDWDRFKGHQSNKTIRKNLDGNLGETLDERVDNGKQSGRWPANIILDPYTAELLDEQSGQTKSGNIKPHASNNSSTIYGNGSGFQPDITGSHIGDIGGASRFFYVAKASKRDRNEGLDELLETPAADMVDREPDSAGMNSPRAGAGRTSGAKNFHPTVKPTSLMEYLIKLVTPPNGTVLDPFTGSGSTGKAAILQGFDFIGIEMTEEYLPIIEGRLKHAEAIVAERIKETSDKQSEVLF
jgi:site-specific DNA-methyltransferase (adenine-specific)